MAASDVTTPNPSAGVLADIAVSLIKPGNNDRKHFEPNALRVLADSIARDGLAMRPLVRPMDGGAWYQIVAGERRFRAMSTLLNWTHIPVVIRELSDEQASALMLTENTARVDLDSIAEALAYKSRRDLLNWSDKEIALRAGVSVGRVQDRIALLSLTPDIQHYIKIGQFPLGHALMIADLDPDRQRIAIRAWNNSPAMPAYKFKIITEPLRASMIEESQLNMFGEAELELLVEDEVKRLNTPDTPQPLTRKQKEVEFARLQDLTATLSAGVETNIDALIMALQALKAAGSERVTVALSDTGTVNLTGNNVESVVMTVDPVVSDNHPHDTARLDAALQPLTTSQLASIARRFKVTLTDPMADAPHKRIEQAQTRWTPAAILKLTQHPALARKS